MKIYLMGQNAFLDLNNGEMLCIGTKREIDQADEKKLIEIIYEAIVLSKYQALNPKGAVLH